MDRSELTLRQSWTLEQKIEWSSEKIRDWYEYWEGQVYVSFSGGKDSTVLLHLVRAIYPEVPAVFVNTGLEYPEILKFVKTIDNVTTLRPKMKFKDVIDKYGYPVISKAQSQYIRQYRNAKSEKTKHLRWYGSEKGNFKISEKWKYLVESPFKISDQCCDIIKKAPLKAYQKETQRKPIIGTMAEESLRRQMDYIKQGCNNFTAKTNKISHPISFWVEKDIYEYITKNNIQIAKIYETEKRTGCMFCMFGVHYEKEPNRFQRMKTQHPKHYDYCINKLGCGKVLDFIGVKY